MDTREKLEEIKKWLDNLALELEDINENLLDQEDDAGIGLELDLAVSHLADAEQKLTKALGKLEDSN